MTARRRAVGCHWPPLAGRPVLIAPLVIVPLLIFAHKYGLRACGVVGRRDRDQYPHPGGWRRWGRWQSGPPVVSPTIRTGVRLHPGSRAHGRAKRPATARGGSQAPAMRTDRPQHCGRSATAARLRRDWFTTPRPLRRVPSQRTADHHQRRCCTLRSGPSPATCHLPGTRRSAGRRQAPCGPLHPEHPEQPEHLGRIVPVFRMFRIPGLAGGVGIAPRHQRDRLAYSPSTSP